MIKIMKENIKYVLSKRLFYVSFSACTLAALIVKGIAQCYESDLWFFLYEGQKFLTSGFSYVNTATIVSDLGLVVQQWLWDVIVYGAYSQIGFVGIAAISIAAAVCYFVAYYKFLGYAKLDKWARFFITLVAFIISTGYLTIRPNGLNMAVLVFELVILEQYKKTGKKRVLAILPLLTLFVINFHASMWIVNFLFIIPYVFPGVHNSKALSAVVPMKRREYDVKPLLFIMIPMAATLFINPYGLGAILYLFNTDAIIMSYIGIAELSSISVISVYAIPFIASVALYSIFFIGRRKEIAPERFYLFCGCTIIGLTCLRQYLYLVLATVILLMEILDGIDGTEFHDWLNDLPVITHALMFFMFTFIVSQIPSGLEFNISDSETTPIEAVAYLDEYADEGTTIYTTFNCGAYFEWSGYTIFVDARPELYMESINGTEDVILDMLEVMGLLDLEVYEEFKAEYQFDYWMGVLGSYMACYLEMDEEMVPVVKTEDYILYQYLPTGA